MPPSWLLGDLSPNLSARIRRRVNVDVRQSRENQLSERVAVRLTIFDTGAVVSSLPHAARATIAAASTRVILPLIIESVLDKGKTVSFQTMPTNPLSHDSVPKPPVYRGAINVSPPATM